MDIDIVIALQKEVWALAARCTALEEKVKRQAEALRPFASIFAEMESDYPDGNWNWKASVDKSRIRLGAAWAPFRAMLAAKE